MKKFKYIFFALFLCLVANSVWADGGVNPAIGDPSGFDEEPYREKIPLDGGVSLLIAAGAAYGAKKYREYKMKEK